MTALKKSSIILSTLILLVFQFVGYTHQASAQSLEKAVTVSVQDQNGDDIIPLTAISLTDGETAFDVLKKVAQQKNVKLQTHSTSYGEQLDSIGGMTPVWDTADDSKHFYWGFIINGALASVGSSSYTVKPGDDLDFRVINDHPTMVKTTVSVEGDGVGAQYQNKSVSIVKGSSAYDAIKQAFKENEVDAPMDSQYFAYIANIDDIIQNGQYLGVYINNQSATVGVSSYMVKDGDLIDLKVTGTSTDSGAGSGDTTSGGTADETTTTPSVSIDQLSNDIKQTIQYVIKNGVDNTYEAMGLRQAGQKLPQGFIDSLAKELQDNHGEYRNVTDYENTVLSITAAGGDASHFAGYNLVKSIYNNERMTNQGNNGPIYALLALDSGQYKVPANVAWTRDKLVNFLLKSQLADGGWALYGKTASPDITGMALSALAPYKADSKVQEAIDKAANWLSSQQNKNGGFGVATNGGDSSESTAQVIMGLVSTGINPTGKAFTKADGDLVTHLLSFIQKDGGFAHLQADKKSNTMATSQALMALVAYQNDLNAKGPVFQVNNNGMSVQPFANSTGQSLPNTATDAYNLIVFGLVLVILGSFILIYYKRRRA